MNEQRASLTVHTALGIHSLRQGVKEAYLYSTYYELLTSKEPWLARVNEGSHSSTCHPHVYQQVQMNHTCLYSAAAGHHRTLAGTYFPSR